MILKLIRHGQSQANTGEVSPQEVGDHTVSLTEKGHAQARAAGELIGETFLRESLIYRSPYKRTRQTLAGVLA